MGMIGLSELRANAWKIATIVVTIAAFGALAVAYIENRHLTKVNANLDIRLNHPVTGEIAKRTRAETEKLQLVEATKRQTEALRSKAATDARVLEDTRQRLAAAKAETRVARDQVAAFLRRPPQGGTVCEQYEDIDRRGMEELK